MIDITPIVNVLIALLTALITAFLLPWLKKKTAAEQRQDLVFWLESAVKAAEELYAGSGKGNEKAAYVRKFMEERGVCLDYELEAALIDAKVWELINRYKKGMSVEGISGEPD